MKCERRGLAWWRAGLIVLVMAGVGCVSEGPGSDFDRDGLNDEIEDPNENFEFDPGETSFFDTDTDADTLCDGLPGGAVAANDPCTGCEDCDNDGVWQPCRGETDPLNDDTDNDGVRDDQDAAPLGGIDCSGGNDPQLAPGDSLPPGKPFPSES